MSLLVIALPKPRLEDRDGAEFKARCGMVNRIEKIFERGKNSLTSKLDKTIIFLSPHFFQNHPRPWLTTRGATWRVTADLLLGAALAFPAPPLPAAPPGRSGVRPNIFPSR